jgi:hypothetical protein
MKRKVESPSRGGKSWRVGAQRGQRSFVTRADIKAALFTAFSAADDDDLNFRDSNRQNFIVGGVGAVGN